MPEGYCVKCKAKKEIADAVEELMKNGRKAIKGKCPTCGVVMFKILGGKASAPNESSAKEAKATALEYKEEATEWADENAEELRGYVRAQPVQSLLIAGGLGVFLGAIFLRR